MKKSKLDTISIFTWIWQSYLKTALIPLMVVELVFVAIYFSASNWSRMETMSFLQESANFQLNILAEKEADLIDKQLADISKTTLLYQKQTILSLQQNASLSTEDLNRLAYSANGAYYTVSDKADGGAAVFYSGFAPINDAEREKAAKLLSLQDLMKNIVSSHPLAAAIYINTHDSLNVIYPYFNVLEQYPDKMNIPEYNFYYEADYIHNAHKKVVWTDAYLDPAGHGWMASAIAPVYTDDFLEGVVGIDVTINTIANQTLNWEFPWNGYGVLVGKDGTILALPEQGEEDWGLNELTDHEYEQAIMQDTFKPDDFNVYKRAEFAAVADQLKRSQHGYTEITLNNNRQLVSWNTVSETGWKLLVVVPEANIYQNTNAINLSLMQIGILMVAGLILFYSIFFYILSKQTYFMSKSISEPLNEINTVLHNIGKGDYYQPEPEMPVTELKETAHKLIEMGVKLGDSNKELLLAQNELQQSEQNLHALVNSIDDIIIQIDESGLINQIWSKIDISILKFFDTKTTTICSLIDPEHSFSCMEKIQNVVNTSQPETMEFCFETSQGKRWFQARISRIANTSHTLVFSARDITDRIFMEMSIKAAKEDAENANRAKSEFLSNMSHELRTPLNAVLGFSQLLELNPEEPLSEAQSQYVSEIIRAGEHLLTLINEILDLSMIESGRYSLSNEPVELIFLGEEIISLMQPLADKNQITVTYNHPELDTLITVTDRTRLKQILINLISNAIKYNRPSGTVTIKIEKAAALIKFHVFDTGYGIPEAQLSNIFNPFLRLSDLSNPIEGTGIGLTVVKQLSSLVNGNIYVESSIGEGSHFWLEVPFTKKSDLPDDTDLVHVDVLQALLSRPYKLLYVEDNQVNLKLMKSTLEKIPNIELISANNGELGIELAKAQQPDLIILDIHLSGIDGYEVLRRLKVDDLTKKILVVALSASAMEADIKKGIMMGFTDYFTKPLNIPLFLTKIFELLTKQD